VAAYNAAGWTDAADNGNTAKYGGSHKAVVIRDGLTSAAAIAAYLAGASGGASPASPLPLTLSLNLADSANGWAALLNVIAAANKYVALDLSASSVTGMSATAGEFDPGAANTGESRIVTLVLPAAATSISEGFYDMYNIHHSTFRYFTALTSVSGANVLILGKLAFDGRTGLTGISFPKAAAIGEAAFWGCTGLTGTLSFPELTDIGNFAFYGCTGLTGTLSLPELTGIGTSAFYGCTGLTALNLPELTGISSSAFYGCTGLTVVNSAVFPALESIADSAFAGCTSLGTVDLPAVTSIGQSAFQGCTGLSSVTFSSASAITLGNSAFEDCTSLATVTLNSALSIGSAAFMGCSSLSSVTLPKATSIGDLAFDGTGTGNLTLTLGSAANLTPPTLGVAMFNGVDSAKPVIVKVPSGATGYAASLPITYSGADTTDCWGNGFRGGGWSGGTMTYSGGVNSNITLTIETYTP
jgi:hypothetical protein